MKKLLFKRILTGVANGFPMVRSIVDAVKKQEPQKEGEINEPKRIDIISITAELLTVGLIAAFIFKKIDMETLKQLLSLF